MNMFFYSLIGTSIVSIVVAIIENKYHLIDKIKKEKSILFNEGTEATMLLEYETHTDFDKIKSIFKETFGGQTNLDIKRNSEINMSFNYNIFSINLISSQSGNLFIEVERMGCGIKNLKEKIYSFLAKLNDLSTKYDKEDVLFNFISCDLTFSLPYKWFNSNLNIPKNLELKEYTIDLTDREYKSEIKIRLNKVNVKTDAIESITKIIDNFT